ncbi:MAG TPA: peptidylprolyl isomerase [Candidatus Tyrphobacter sp.]
MSKALRLIAGSVTFLLGAALASCAGGGSVVSVNGQAISRSQFDAKLESSPIARNILQQMVQEALIEQYAKDNNISITDAQIQARENQLQANYPGTQWSEMLAARGLTEQDVHDALRLQLILDAALAKNITIGNAEIASYFNKNHAAFDKPAQICASHILVSDLATANRVEAALKTGGTGAFAQLAQQYSVDPGSKAKGGSLGCFRRGAMVPAFDQAAFSLPVGQISRPVRSPFGFHIILVTSKQPAVRATLASVSDRIRLTLTQQQEAPLVQPFLQSLQQKANISINDQRFAGLFPTPMPAAPAPGTAAPAPQTSSPPASPAH